MAELSLWFAKSETATCELERSRFISNPNAAEIIAVRGKTAGAYKGAGTFQWTPGVKAVTVIFLTALVRHLKGTKTFLPLLEGHKGSLASSLDYALNKQPEWLFDMFGADEKSNAYLRQLLLRSNIGRRRHGPVSISLNEQLFSAQSIKVYIGDVLIQDAYVLQRMATAIINSESGKTSNNGNNRKSEQISGSLRNLLHSIPMFMDKDSLPLIVPVSEDDVEDIYRFEQNQFPDSHAKPERLLEWLRHDSNNYMCIKEPGQPLLAYYLIMFMKPEWMQKYLAGELSEVDITSAHLLEPSDEIYAKQDTLHITVFASRRHASIFTFDLLWHLVGRLLDLAINGQLTTIYAEIATEEGKMLVERFGFQLIRQTASGGLVYKLQPSLALVREWEWRYTQRTFCKIPIDKLQARQIMIDN